MRGLDEFGRRLAAEQDRILEQRDDVAIVRARLEAGVAPRTSGGGRRTARIAAAATIAIAASAVLVYVLSTGPAPSGGVSSPSGSRITAPAGARVPIRFADGSLVELEPLASAWVYPNDSPGSRLSIGRGDARVDVVHNPGRVWNLEAGPFTIRVTGTRFRVGWDAAAEVFRLDLERGRVVVNGPMLEGGRRMEAGDVLQVWVGERRVEVRSAGGRTAALPAAAETVAVAPAACPSPPPAVEPAPIEAFAATAPVASAPAIERRPPVPPVDDPEPVFDPGTTASGGPSADWIALARAGRYAEALAAVEAAGFERTVSGASPADLLALGDIARLAGRPDRAEAAYLEVRRRFAGTRDAGTAAFGLARIAFDVRTDYDAAERWLSTCLQEPGAGGLAREAMGRRIEALDRAGRPSEAADAARSYLDRFPTGPHADYARSMVEPGAAAP